MVALVAVAHLRPAAHPAVGRHLIAAGSGIGGHGLLQAAVHRTRTPAALGRHLSSDSQKRVAVQGVGRETHRGVAPVQRHPLVGGVNAVAVEGLLKRGLLVGVGKRHRGTPAVERQVEVARQEVGIGITSRLTAVRGVENLVGREAAAQVQGVFLSDLVQTLGE